MPEHPVQNQSLPADVPPAPSSAGAALPTADLGASPPLPAEGGCTPSPGAAGPGLPALAALYGTIANGYLLLYLNVNLEFGSGVLSLLPAWAGYLLIGRALPRLEAHTPDAGLLRPLCTLLAAWNLLDWLCALLGADSGRLPALPLIAAAAGLYFHFQLLTDLAQAIRFCLPGQSSRLLYLRTIQTLFLTLAALSAFSGTAAAGGPGSYLNVFVLAAAVLTAFALWWRLRVIRHALLELADDTGAGGS